MQRVWQLRTRQPGLPDLRRDVPLLVKERRAASAVDTGFCFPKAMRDRGEGQSDDTALFVAVMGRAVFDPNRFTSQAVRTCFPTFNAALIAFVESAPDAAQCLPR
jgi:hypothetical protein